MTREIALTIAGWYKEHTHVQPTEQIGGAGRLVARGGTAEVFAWENEASGRVLKLFYDWVPPGRVASEFNVSQALRSAGLPVPQAYEVLHLDGRAGILFERIDGVSLLALVERRPWKLFYAARVLAELHAEVHRSNAPGELPTQRSQIETWLAGAGDFSEEERRAAENSLAALPDGDTLCHGDFHPANILFSSRGPVIIDWIAATKGHSYADVARTSVLFQEAELPVETTPLTRLIFRFARGILHRTYLSRYLEICGGTLDDVTKWHPAQRAAASAWRCGASRW